MRPTGKPMTAKQRKAYNALKYEFTYSLKPQLSRVARDIGIHVVSLIQHIELLERKGYVKRVRKEGFKKKKDIKFLA